MDFSTVESKERLKEVLKIAQGTMSRRAFSKMLGVSPTAVILWERGETVPDLENLIKIAKLSGYSLEELIYYLAGKTSSEPSFLEKILREIHQMPIEEVVKVTSAGMNRLEKTFQCEKVSKI